MPIGQVLVDTQEIMGVRTSCPAGHKTSDTHNVISLIITEIYGGVLSEIVGNDDGFTEGTVVGNWQACW